MLGAWNEERVERLKVDYEAGLSMSVIAVNLGGGITRNAVIGKVHRLGLSASCTTRPKRPVPLSGTTPKPRKNAAVAKPARRYLPTGQVVNIAASTSRECVSPLDMPETEHRGTQAINILRDNACRWPVGDPTTHDFRFCGGRSGANQSYCPHHARLAYQPASKSKVRHNYDRFSENAPRLGFGG